jgi:hypothetical protein
MAFNLKDASSGVAANVNSAGQLDVDGKDEQALLAAQSSEAYGTTATETPTGAGDFFFHLVNGSTTRLMYVSQITASAATDEKIQVSLNDIGTASGGGAQVPVNKYAGSPGDAECTCEGAADITGLASGTVVATIQTDGAAGESVRKFDPPLILPPGIRMSLIAVTGAIAISADVEYYYV